MTDQDRSGRASAALSMFAEYGISRRERYVRAALFGAWLLLVIFLVSRHVFWRDEVRAFTIALRGESVIDMLRGLQGEGHPALWYLLLRGAHFIVPVREVLPAVSVAVAAAAMALLAFRSPFRTSVLAVIMFGALGLFEYAVSARNYGISMTLLFVLADRYPSHRDRGIILGLLLALLCNTNVLSAFLAAAFLLFWLIEIISEDGLKWTPRHRLFVINAAIAALGALICFLLVYPTVHDAAVVEHPDGFTAWSILQAIPTIGASFNALAPPMAFGSIIMALLAVVIAGSLMGLLLSPGALLSTLAVLGTLGMFFQLVYPGHYRHQGLFLAYLIVMYWMVAKGRGGHWPPHWRLVDKAGRTLVWGSAFFLLLLAMQVPRSAVLGAAEARGIPVSSARNLAEILSREGLGEATLIAVSDVMLEPMPYYSGNPLYLMREQRFGNVVRFTRKARLHLTLQDVLDDAVALEARTGRPVVILMQHMLDETAPPILAEDHYVGTFTAGPDEVGRFLASTRKLASLRPTISDESYDVYLLKRPG